MTKNQRVNKQCWRCRYFSDNFPEHFKAIVSASGRIEKICTHGQDTSAPTPCTQFAPLSGSNSKSALYVTKSYGNWKQKILDASVIQQLA
jgi:hypothetical protein